MSGGGIVVEFPTGRRLRRRSSDHSGTVARLVRSLSASRTTTDGGSAIAQFLSIRLDVLTGMDDETIEGLADLAVGGIVTPASAARLALRHAAESGGFRSDPPYGGAVAPKPSTIALTLAGDVFGEFAGHLRLGKAWLGFAAADSLAPLLEICPSDRGSVCLLVGCDGSRRNTVRVLAPRDWRRSLATWSQPPMKRHHHVLVLGGIPATGEARSSILVDLRNAVLAGGTVDLVGGGARERNERRRRVGPMRISHDLLTLIEFAMPGLVEPERAGSGVR